MQTAIFFHQLLSAGSSSTAAQAGLLSATGLAVSLALAIFGLTLTCQLRGGAAGSPSSTPPVTPAFASLREVLYRLPAEAISGCCPLIARVHSPVLGERLAEVAAMNMVAASFLLARSSLLAACTCGTWLPTSGLSEVCGNAPIHPSGVYAHAAAVSVAYLGCEALPSALLLYSLRELPRSAARAGAEGGAATPLVLPGGSNSKGLPAAEREPPPQPPPVERQSSVHGGRAFLDSLRIGSPPSSPGRAVPGTTPRGPTGYFSFIDVIGAPPSPFRWSFPNFAAATTATREQGPLAGYAPESPADDNEALFWGAGGEAAAENCGTDESGDEETARGARDPAAAGTGPAAEGICAPLVAEG